MAPNSIRAICKVAVAESPSLRALVGCFLKREVRGTARRLLLLQVASCWLLALAHQAVVMRVCQPGPRPASCPAADPPALPRPPLAAQINFKVTQKSTDTKGFDWVGLSWCWPYFAYFMVFSSSVAFFVLTAVLRWYSPQQLLLNTASVMWGALICISFWPPVAWLLPRAEEEQGWQVLWKPLPGYSSLKLPQLLAEPAGGWDASVHGRDASGLYRSHSHGYLNDSAERLLPAALMAQQQRVTPSPSPRPSPGPSPRPCSSPRQRGPKGRLEVSVDATGEGQAQWSMHTVPSFEQRQKPQRTLAFQLISFVMVACLVGAAVMDYLLANRIIVLAFD